MIENNDKILIGFIYETIQLYKQVIITLGPNNQVVKKISNALSHLIRQYDKVEYVSKELVDQLLLKKQIKSPSEIFDFGWKDRKLLNAMYEHTTPVKELKESLIWHVTNKEEAEEYLINNAIICWMTYEENRKLDANGFKSKRPGGWRNCYEISGVLVYSKSELIKKALHKQN
jgi:hypothetical protein